MEYNSIGIINENFNLRQNYKDVFEKEITTDKKINLDKFNILKTSNTSKKATFNKLRL